MIKITVKMKQLLLITCISALLFACNDNEKAAPKLNLNPTVLELEHTESNRTIYVESNVTWAAESNSEWCKVATFNKFGNDSVEIKVMANTTYDTRIAYIAFNNPEKTVIQTLKIIQNSLGRIMRRRDDSLILVKFYDTLQGDKWTSNSGWKTASLDKWHGVVVKNDRVTAIKIENNNLVGVLISELGQLTMLDTLSIVSEKGITGVVPIAITTLPNLVYLNISGTSITGNIPPEIGNLPSLEELIISENLSITGMIPSEIVRLANLRTLVINNIQQRSSPFLNEASALRKLTFLSIDSCNLRLDSDVNLDFPNLEYLSLNNCNLSNTISDLIVKMPKLKSLILSNNRLYDTIPAILGDLELTVLRLENNELSGIIPESLGELELTVLHLENNFLEGAIPEKIRIKIDDDLFKVCPQNDTTFSNYTCPTNDDE
jgi:Leucine-rich repeat (LRR) protein